MKKTHCKYNAKFLYVLDICIKYGLSCYIFGLFHPFKFN
ncbi:hypothetical protein M2137_002782 [Parabacteroides sp. PFB2-10]|nr:hypothetical protein [Parabacteroides sp. PFB2-10]